MNQLMAVPTAGALISVSFSEALFDRFIDYTDVKDSTLKGYLTCIRQFIKWLKDNGITQPTRETIKDYKTHLEQSSYTAGTRAQYLRAVKQFFKWTASEGLYPNIADNIKGAKVRHDNTKKEAFDREALLKILGHIDTTTETGKRDYAMILLSFQGALRIIEMQRADIGDLQTFSNQPRLYIQGKGHDDKDDYIKIEPETAAAIADYLACRPGAKKFEALFVGAGNRAKNQRLTEPSISRIIKTRFKEAGYDCGKLTAHSLRHSSITADIEQGDDLYGAQRHARHISPTTTEGYIHRVDKAKDTSERRVLDWLFRPDQPDPMKEAVEILQSLPQAAQLEALEYLKGLQGADLETAV